MTTDNGQQVMMTTNPDNAHYMFKAALLECDVAFANTVLLVIPVVVVFFRFVRVCMCETFSCPVTNGFLPQWIQRG